MHCAHLSNTCARRGAEPYREGPIDHAQELALEHVQLADGDAADARVEAVGAEGVAEGLAGDRDGGDEEAMAGEGRERE